MAVGERAGGWAARALLLAGLTVLLLPWIVPVIAPGTPPPADRTWAECRAPGDCRPTVVGDLRLDRPVTTLVAVFDAPRAGGGDAPLAVHVAAMASAEVFWNGARIGGNGRVGPDAGREVPGRFSAAIPVPPERIRAGPNRVEVRLSAHHLWAPVRKPIHQLVIGPYADPLRPTLAHYLPTLLAIGALGLAFVGFAARRLLHPSGGGLTAAVLSGVVLLQAVIEASKLALTYPYPWQLARLAAIAGLSAVSALLVAAMAIRFLKVRAARAALIAAVMAAVAVALLMPPWWDAKAVWALRAGLAAALIASAAGVRRGERHALPAALGCLAALALSTAPGFLDLLSYLMFVVLFGVLAWRAIQDVRVAGAEADRRAAAAERRAAAIPDARVVLIPDGGARRRVAVREILYVRADDDYSLVCLEDGRSLLATINLAGLLRLLPDDFIRIHRSHAVNRARIGAVHRSGRRGRAVEMADGAVLPVGRTYWAAVEAQAA